MSPLTYFQEIGELLSSLQGGSCRQESRSHPLPHCPPLTNPRQVLVQTSINSHLDHCRPLLTGLPPPFSLPLVFSQPEMITSPPPTQPQNTTWLPLLLDQGFTHDLEDLRGQSLFTSHSTHFPLLFALQAHLSSHSPLYMLAPATGPLHVLFSLPFLWVSG